MRTRGPVQRSRPAPALLWAAVPTAALAVVLPFTPLGHLFPLLPLPPTVLGALLLLTIAYGAATEVTKRWFYRTVSAGSS